MPPGRVRRQRTEFHPAPYVDGPPHLLVLCTIADWIAIGFPSAPVWPADGPQGDKSRTPRYRLVYGFVSARAGEGAGIEPFDIGRVKHGQRRIAAPMRAATGHALSPVPLEDAGWMPGNPR